MATISLHPFGAGGQPPVGAGSNTGTMSEAEAFAENNQDVVFTWLLKDTGSNDEDITMMLWHIGDGVFIDAVGSIISSDE